MKKIIIFLLMFSFFVCGSLGVCAEDLNEEISLTETTEEPEEITFEEAFGEILPEEIVVYKSESDAPHEDITETDEQIFLEEIITETDGSVSCTESETNEVASEEIVEEEILSNQGQNVSITEITTALPENGNVKVQVSCTAPEEASQLAAIFMAENDIEAGKENIIHIDQHAINDDGTYTYNLNVDKITDIVSVESLEQARVTVRVNCDVPGSAAVQTFAFSEEQYCNVVFKNYDGTVLYSASVLSGTVPEYPGRVPERADDTYCTYEFSGWYPELAAITEDTEYVAQYERTAKDPNLVAISEIVGIKTHSVAFDNIAKTITVKALSGYAAAGFAIHTYADSTWDVKSGTADDLSLYVGTSGTLNEKVVAAKQEKGMQQTFQIDITCGTSTETYTVNFEFIDESLINFTDVLGVRVVSYDVNYASHKINLIADRYSMVSLSAGFGLVLPENVTAEYTLLETTDGGTTVSRPTTTAYTSTYLGMESGYYGAMPLRVMPMSNGVTQVTEAVLTNTVLGESITWTINLMFREPAYEGDVDISELIGLRTTSATFDNEAKTITLVADSSNSSAGFTVISDNPSSVRQLTAESGKNIAYGTLDGNRYVVAYQAYGTTQTYRVKVFGGEDGYEYSWYTVTITFVEGAAPETVNMSANATIGGEMAEINSAEEVELEDIVWVDDYEASLEVIPDNLVWDEELMDFVPAE